MVFLLTSQFQQKMILYFSLWTFRLTYHTQPVWSNFKLMVLNFFPIRTSQVPFQAVNLSIYLNLIFLDKRLLMSMLPCGIRIKL